MRKFSRFLIIITAIALASAVVTWRIIMALQSPSAIDTALAHGGGYDQAASQLRTNLKQNLAEGTNSVTKALLGTTIDHVVTGQLIRQTVAPTLNDLTTWLTNSSDDNPPNVHFTTGNIQSALVASTINALGGSGAQIRFEITRILPNSVSLIGDNSQQTEQLSTALITVKHNFLQLKQDLVIEIVATAILLVCLILLAGRNRRARLRRPGWALIWAAGFVLLIGYPLQFIIRTTVLSSGSFAGDQGAVVNVVRALVSVMFAGLWPYAAVLAGLGAILVIASLLVPARHTDTEKLNNRRGH